MAFRSISIWPLFKQSSNRPDGSTLRVDPSPRGKPAARVQLAHPDPVAQVDKRYLSFSIDISVLAGGFWWEGAKSSKRGLGTIRVPPLDLGHPKLDKLVQSLGPAYLRIGGSEADKVHYFDAPEDEPNALVLTQTMWDQLHQFTQRNDLRLAFTVKYGLFQRKLHGDWRGHEVEKLLQYSRDRNYRIHVFELGNELNAYWAFHGLLSQPRATNLAVDYHRFAKLMRQYQPEARVIGPGSAFWPRLGETIRPFSNITRRFLEVCRDQSTPIDIVDWHYYPFQSRRSPIRTRTATLSSLLSPRSLNDFARYADQLRQYRDEFCPDAELWAGETGSAQCGGQPKLSDRFASCFWWADQLGQGALTGHKVMIRQSLVGGEYGMVDRLTLKPRPDFWLSWLWKTLMGEQVYRVQHTHHLLRCYCHNTPGREGKTLLIINLSGKTLQVNPDIPGHLYAQYKVTAKRLQSKKLRINDQKARFRGGNFNLDDFPCAPIGYRLSGYSINFWLFRDGEEQAARPLNSP